MRNIVFRFDGSPAFARALRDGDQELPLPAGESVVDGERVLAIFEIGDKRRATASAARGLVSGASSAAVGFDRRDWERLIEFAEAGSLRMMAAAPVASNVIGLGSGQAPASSGKHALPKPRVLMVDGDRDAREVARAVLETAGLSVELVASAEGAVERIHRGGCDLVVVDWKLPGMNGLDLCREIRRDPTHAALPILFLSARSATEDVVDAFHAGADDYVVKPFRAPELVARIFSMVRRARRVPGNPA